MANTTCSCDKEEINRSQERLQAFIEQSSEGIWCFEIEQPFDVTLDEDRQVAAIFAHGYLSECNTVMAAMYGFEKAADLIGARLNELLVPSDPDNVAFLRGFIRSGYRLTNAESREVDRFGNEVHFANNLVGVVEEGKLLRAWGSQRDITAQKRAEEKLRRSEELYRSLFENNPLPAWVFDHETLRFLAVNDAAVERYGYSREAFLAMTILEIRPESEAAPLRRTRAGRAAGVPRAGTWLHRKQDGSTFEVEITWEDLIFEGRPATLVLANDVSERVRAEQETLRARQAAEAANRAKSEFLANMSHEIRTPLNGILGMTELTLNTELQDDQRECLELVKLSANSLTEIVGDLLDFSKIEAGKLRLEVAPFSLRELIGDIMTTFALRAREQGLEMACTISPDMPDTLVGDAARLRQVFVNLIGNALKFTAAGHVTVEAWSLAGGTQEPTAHFIVKDTGIGIAAEKQQTIFEAFTQADTSTTRRYGGTGLGLSIAAQLVTLMGGRIWVESEVGSGSAFHFTARLTPPSDEPDEGEAWSTEAATQATGDDATGDAIESGEPAEAAPDKVRLRVLLADDSLVSQCLMMRLLEREGHTVVTARTGGQALAICEADDFDVVLLDLHMPEMAEDEVAAAIRRREAGEAGAESALNKPHSVKRRVPIIAMTGNASPDDGRRCREAGMDGYLAKPVRAQQLLDVLSCLTAPANAATFGKVINASNWRFDREAVLAGLQGDEELLRDCINLCLSHAPALLADLRAALAGNDAVPLELVPSRFASMLGPFRAAQAIQLADACVAAAHRGDLATAEGVCAQLEQEMASLNQTLADHL